MRSAFALAVAGLLGGCASAPKTRTLDRARPIEIHESRWLGTTYAQEGVRLDSVELISALVSTPEGREHVRTASRNGTRGGALLMLSLALATGAAFADDPAVQTGLVIGGLGSLLGSSVFMKRAEASSLAAARAYNASLREPAAPATPPTSTSTRSQPARAAGLSLSLAF